MSETRISREEIKSIAEERKCERADAADKNDGGAGECHCENGTCDWHDNH